MDFDFSPVDSVDKVPEQFRSLYSQNPSDDGKFTIDPNFKPVADALLGFNKSNKQLRQELKTKAVDLSPLAEFGDSPAAIAEAVKAAVESAGANKNQDVNKAVEAAKAAMAQANAKELEKHTQRNQALQNQLYGLMVENSATAAVAELKGVPELLMPFIKQQVKVQEEDGQFKVLVVDGQGETRYGATGSPMTIKELVAEMKGNERFGRLFESEQQGGGGMPPNGGRRPPQQQGRELSANEKIAQGLNKGQYKARGGRA